MSSRAASGESSLKFPAGNEDGPDLQKIYAVVQCTPNLNESECNNCLVWAISQVPNCCNNRQGGRIITPICNFRYKSSRFYASQADVPLSALSPEVSPPPTSPSTPPSTNTTSSSPPPSAATTSSKGKKITDYHCHCCAYCRLGCAACVCLDLCESEKARKKISKYKSIIADNLTMLIKVKIY